LKLTGLAVITLLIVLGCSGAAFAQGSAVLGFASAGDEGLYCNFEVIEWGPGSENNFYFQGIDDLVDGCFGEVNATVEGNKLSITPGDGSLVNGGPTYGYADNIYDADGLYFSGFQWYVITQTVPSTRLKHYGWVGYAGFSGLEFLGNYGYLSASIPGANKSGKPVLGSTSAASAVGAIKAGSAVKMITK
jgi:hypothetical protein